MLSKILTRFSSAKDTCLRGLHEQLKGKVVDFAGYNLPVNYAGWGIIKEHLHCREKASIFDVSHMGQLIISGPDRLKLLQRTTVGSTTRQSNSFATQCYLTMFLNKQCGIIDDAIACVDQGRSVVRIVVNGANKYIDFEHLTNVAKQQKLNVKIDHLQTYGLIALQGPLSAEVLQPLLPKVQLAKIPFMSQFHTQFQGHDFTITRSGYTGEDGFQISSQPQNVVSITRTLLKNNNVAMAGLGSRDSLRLQAGLCLHGHDINPSTTPLQGSLMWTVHKRKAGDNRLPFIGQDILQKQVDEVKAKKLTIRKRVGFVVSDPGVVRQHCKIFTKQGKEVGETCSGGPSPSLKKSIGMAYIDQNSSADETQLVAVQRDRKFNIVVKKMPFFPSRYYKRWGQL